MVTHEKPDESKWKSIETKQNTGFLPTLAVTLWLGWMGLLTHTGIFLALFGNHFTFLRNTFIILALTSLLLPRNFFGEYGMKIGNWLMHHAARYFALKTTIEDEDSIRAIKDKAIIFALEPHDILPYTVFCFNPSLKRIPGQAGESTCALMTSAVFNIPFIKHVYTWVGGNPVDKTTFRNRLKNKQSLSFVPGGVQEVTMMHEKAEKKEDIILFLKKRKGFIKLALQFGTPIVPVFAFNTDGSYGYFLPKSSFMDQIARKIGFLPLFFWGRWFIPLGIPFCQKIHVVFGKPIVIPKNTDETLVPELVEKYHEIFLKEMKELYDRHRSHNGYEHRDLKII